MQAAASQILDRLHWIGRDVSLLNQPSEEPANRYQGPIDVPDGLTLLATKAILEVGDVPGRQTYTIRFYFENAAGQYEPDYVTVNSLPPTSSSGTLYYAGRG